MNQSRDLQCDGIICATSSDCKWEMSVEESCLIASRAGHGDTSEASVDALCSSIGGADAHKHGRATIRSEQLPEKPRIYWRRNDAQVKRSTDIGSASNTAGRSQLEKENGWSTRCGPVAPRECETLGDGGSQTKTKECGRGRIGLIVRRVNRSSLLSIFNIRQNTAITVLDQKVNHEPTSTLSFSV